MMGGSAGKGTGKDVEGGHGVAVLSWDFSEGKICSQDG
jgi:hypothetical protein